MTQAAAKKQGFTVERYPAGAGAGRRGCRYLWRLLGPDGRTFNSGYQSRRKLLSWLEEHLCQTSPRADAGCEAGGEHVEHVWPEEGRGT